MNTSTRETANHPVPSMMTPSMANRSGAHALATRCPFCQARIVLAHGGAATGVCPNCGLRFTIESPQRAREAAPRSAVAARPPRSLFRARLLVPAAFLALASAATAALAGWALLR